AAAPSIERAICLDELGAFVRAADGAEVPDWSDPFGAPNALMALMPTGGTTGAAKGVVVRNRHFAEMVELALAHWPLAEEPVNLMVAPITHAAGGTAMILATVGATTVMHAGFDPVAVLEAIQTDRV